MHRFAQPGQFQRISAAVVPVCVAVAVLCGALGLYLGLLVAPADYQQGETVRIMYIHVPAALLASALYATMAVGAASFLIWRHPMAVMVAREAAPIGAVFTLICLLTGMLWGKPTWGAYWVWDARLTSMLILLLLYLGYIGVTAAGGYNERTHVASSWLAVIGAINLPIIKFSVNWWNTLHQGESLLRVGGPSIDASMLQPLLLMLAACVSLTVVLLLMRVDTARKETKLRRLHIQRRGVKGGA